MKVAACLIVKDSAKTIERCLDVIRPYVDGVFVYDTGSTDGTVAKLERMNAKTAFGLDGEIRYGKPKAKQAGDAVDVPLAPIVVEPGEWRDDFAWAREQSFAMPDDTFDWVVWLDDDDLIYNAQNLRPLAHNASPEVDGFVVQYDYARDERDQCVCVLWRERLIRRSVGYRWVNPVHEVLVPPEGRTPVFATVQPELLKYIHERPADRYSPDRNLDILRKAAAAAVERGEQPDARTQAYLGTELMAKGEWAEAATHLQAYLDRDDTGWSDERMQVAHKLAMCARVLGNPLASVEIEMQALRERDDWPETYVGLTEAFAGLEAWDRVERWAKRAIELGVPQTALIVNPLEFTLLPQLRLCEAYEALGQYDKAEQWLVHANAGAPGHPAVVDRQEKLQQARFQGETVQAVLKLRETLVRHDENEKAWNLLAAAPYVVADHPAIVKARVDQREMVAHMLKPEEYRRWYEDDPKESTIRDENIDDACKHFGRIQGLFNGLAEQEEQLGRKPRVLDLGCNDWWMGEGLARLGIRCDGVELNRSSYEKALERRDRFGREATIVQGDLHDALDLLSAAGVADSSRVEYDAVVMYEVLEHVPDMQRTLDVLESLCVPGGRIYISTPDGAFERGNIDDWDKVQRKGHLRAIPLSDLADMLLARGDIEDLAATSGDRVGFAAYTPRAKKGTVVFFAGGQWEPWSPVSIRKGGIGGSETALVQVATRLALDGYRVKVYSSSEPGLIGGVLYRPFTAWDPGEECDLLVVSRQPAVFDATTGARKTALWCHDHTYDGLTPERAEKIDHIVVLSDWQRARFERLYPWTADRLTIIRNGITWKDLDGTPRYPNADRPFAARKPRAIYSSSSDRGLDVLLDLWPRIRERVPDAELHVFYGFDVLDRVARVNPQLAAYKQAILAKATELGGEGGGVHLRGRVGQVQLADEMQQARVLAYPTAFLETSCITAMEAQAAGLPIVTSALGALTETAHGQDLIDWSDDEDEPVNRDEAYQERFVLSVVGHLLSDGVWNISHVGGLSVAETLDWSNRTREWVALAAPRQQPLQQPDEVLEEAVA